MKNENQAISLIQECLSNAARDFQYWTPEMGDPNTSDVLFIAHNMLDYIPNSTLNFVKPYQKRVLKLIGFVDSDFIKADDGAIRDISVEELTTRAYKLLKQVRKLGLFNLGIIEDLAISLFIWHGCLCMAKSTRKMDSAGTIYNTKIRMHEYDKLKDEWVYHEERGNIWVKYGVSLAKQLENIRGNSPVEDWIPEDSPYWD